MYMWQAYVKLRHYKVLLFYSSPQMAETLALNFRDINLVSIITWEVHAKNRSDYSTIASCNHWMWLFQNNVRKIYCCSVFSLSETKCPTFGSLIQKMGFISWISPIKYSTSSFVANFSITKSFGLSGWVVKSTPSSQCPSPVNLSDSWVVNSES
jgi:hypothetical protein